MNNLAASNFNLTLHQSPSLAMLTYFAKLPGARVVEVTSSSPLAQNSLIHAKIGNLEGTGRGKTRFLSSIKAVAECLERRFFDEYIEENRNSIPFYKRNSNGFAVHFNPEMAKEAALREALERHILQITYLKHDWHGFYLKDKFIKNNLKITRVISKYQANGHSAGIVLAQSENFPGAAFGYFCDKVEDASSSPRWIHAESESTDKIEPLLNLSKLNKLNPENNINRETYNWFFEPFQMPEFKAELTSEQLPEIEFKTEIFDLQKKWNLDFPLYAAKCDGDKLLPLLIPRKDHQELDLNLTQIFNFYQINLEFPTRNPIL